MRGVRPMWNGRPTSDGDTRPGSANAVARWVRVSAVGTLALLGLSGLSTSEARAQDPAASVAGMVIDAVTETALAGVSVQVEASGRRVTTDAAGRFDLDGERPGPGLLRLDLFGYEEQLVPVVFAGDAEPLTIRLFPRPVEIEGLDVIGLQEVSLSGVVLDARTGEGLPWAQIQFDGRRAEGADENGGFRVEKVKPGGYLILVEKLGYESLYVSIELSGIRDPLVVELEPDDALMAGIEEMVERIDARRNAYGFGPVRMFGEGRLQRSRAVDATRFLEQDAGVLFAPCSGRFAGETCVVARGGGLDRPKIIVDEFPIPCGLTFLATYHPGEFYQVEVYDRGATIRFYTREFMKRTGGRNQTLIPADLAPPLIGGC